MTDTAATAQATGTDGVKRGMAEMLKGGVIMDVVTPEQAKIAEDAGAVAVMALERVPADIRAQGGVARMSDPDMIEGIVEAVSIPVMAKARIGHFVEAQVLQSLGVDYIDESEVLTPADEALHIDKWAFTAPFVCGATNLGEALRRISEGAAMIRSKGEAGTGNVVEATRHMRRIRADIRRLTVLDPGGAPVDTTYEFDIGSSTGTLLLLSGLLALIPLRVSPAAAVRVYGATIRQFGWAIVAILAVFALMWGLSVIMDETRGYHPVSTSQALQQIAEGKVSEATIQDKEQRVLLTLKPGQSFEMTDRKSVV